MYLVFDFEREREREREFYAVPEISEHENMTTYIPLYYLGAINMLMRKHI